MCSFAIAPYSIILTNKLSGQIYVKRIPMQKRNPLVLTFLITCNTLSYMIQTYEEKCLLFPIIYLSIETTPIIYLEETN